MRARHFLSSVFACALAWPLAGQTPAPAMPARVGAIVAVRQSDGSVVFTNLPGLGAPTPHRVPGQQRPEARQSAAAPAGIASNAQGPAAPRLVRAVPARTSRVARVRRPSITALLDAAARRYRLDPRLVREVAWQESGFDPRSVSDKGAMGVMQLMPETARILGVTDPFDPRQNIDGGARYLRDLLHLYRGNIRLSLAAYNAGPAVVAHYGNRIPPFSETRDYVRVITRRLRADGVRVARPARSEAIVLTGRDATGALVYSDVQ